ncbi:methyltransferase domain-containing protein [Kineococcus sp. R8]|uniref:class I SAM-dependent methyltransferase n=1 Tax=Kineococcus siccus TaxID=2696567 RepID=UPI0014131D10|nr:methyltransferase domain-containing protein [Kineococcus siccus]
MLGVEGLALLRGWAGDADRAFTHDRLAEVRRLLDDPLLADHPGVDVARGTATGGYRDWAPTYDGPNRLFELDEPFVDAVLAGLAPGAALDAACGTGRLAERLVRAGHDVVGVDASPEMLAVARRRVPQARFVAGALERLPVADASVDVVVCALALSHLPSLGPAVQEFARVLRPGGHLVVSDVHHELIFRGSVVAAPGPGGGPGLVPTYRHSLGEFLRAFLSHGFAVRACEEPGGPAAEEPPPGPAPAPSTTGADLGPWSLWPWTLMELLPAATRAAWDVPLVVTWHAQREGGDGRA